ncbi:UPF0158 family protein [Amycolatopsis japonica]|uniref:UPF0158 family protein n=1 Tax=Amycolatopsis japonica TaxID=208439 RepID=UPI0033F94741
MLGLEKFDLGGIAMALQDQTDYEHFHLVDPRTGEMGLWTQDGGIDGRNPIDLDDVDLTVIEPLPSSVWYQNMADFAAGLSDERAGERLSRALSGKGAFRRFKNELHDRYPHLVPVWNAFSDNRAKLRAVEWLAGNALIDEGSADRFAAEYPDPGLL